LDDTADFPPWVKFVQEMSHALVAINSSLNFLVYVIL